MIRYLINELTDILLALSAAWFIAVGCGAAALIVASGVWELVK